MTKPGRRFLVLAGLVATAAAVAGLAGCASREAAPAPAAASAPSGHRYTESISSVLVSQDGGHLVAMGSNHHYIFDAPPSLVAAIHSPIHPQLGAVFSAFHVDATGTVTGDYTLTLAADASPEAERTAAAIGFARGDDGRWHEAGHLKGKRYTGWAYKMGREQDRLNQAYTIEITTEDNRADVATDDAATPIRVAADGVQLIYYAPLAPIIIPFAFLNRAHDH